MKTISDLVRRAIKVDLVKDVLHSEHLNFEGERVVQVTVVYDDQVGRPTASEMNRVADELWHSAALGGAVPVLVFRSERDSLGLEAA